MTSTPFNRRSFIKLAGAAALGTTLNGPLAALARPAEPPEKGKPIEYRPARVLSASVAEYDNLTPQKRSVIRTYRRDARVWITGEEFIGPGPARNRIWYRTRDGFVYSAWLQLMEPYQTPRVYTELGEWGRWIQSIVPAAPAYAEPSTRAGRRYVYHYGTVYHATEAYVDAAGVVWYNTVDEYASKEDEISPTNHWVRAVDMRVLEYDEFRPINPYAPHKRIVVDLPSQSLTCYEGDTVLLTSRVATGASFTVGEEQIDYGTPRGDFSAILKMPSRHMRAPEVERDTDAWYDLPGVPWNIFFTYEGIAIHGTYWHNDYGLPRSHGCVNVPIDVARFIYLWCDPIAPYNDDFVQGDLPTTATTTISVV